MLQRILFLKLIKLRITIRELEGKWIRNSIKFDSGATSSVVGNKDLLSNFCESTGKKFFLPDGSFVSSGGVGELELKTKGFRTVLRDVHFIPDLKVNLVSVGKLTDNGYYVGFSSNFLYVHINKQDRLNRSYRIKLGYRSPISQLYIGYPNGIKELQDEEPEVDDSYIYSISDLGIEQVVADVFGKKDLYYYHLVGNHMSLTKLENLVRHKKINVLIKDKEARRKVSSCIICKHSNSRQISHNSKTQIPPTRRLERIHSDTMGPMIVDSEKQYLTTLIDHFTGYTIVVIHPIKAVADTIMIELKKLNSMFPGEMIHAFRSDNAKELPSKSLLATLGIVKEVIPPYSPEMNGLAESHNRVILRNLHKCIINFPNRFKEVLSLFRELVGYTVYIKNHTPCDRDPSRPGWTPYELFMNARFTPNYWQFGLDVIVTLLNSQEAKGLKVEYNKLFPPTLPGVFVGYGTDSNSYRILVLHEDNPIKTFVNVTFLNTMKNIEKYFQSLDGFRQVELIVNGENYRYLGDASRKDFFTPIDPEVENEVESPYDTGDKASVDAKATIPETASNSANASRSSHTPIASTTSMPTSGSVVLPVQAPSDIQTPSDGTMAKQSNLPTTGPLTDLPALMEKYPDRVEQIVREKPELFSYLRKGLKPSLNHLSNDKEKVVDNQTTHSGEQSTLAASQLQPIMSHHKHLLTVEQNGELQVQPSDNSTLTSSERDTTELPHSEVNGGASELRKEAIPPSGRVLVSPTTQDGERTERESAGGPTLSVEVGRINDEYSLNPSREEIVNSYTQAGRASTLKGRKRGLSDASEERPVRRSARLAGRISKPPESINNLRVVDELIPIRRNIFSVMSFDDPLGEPENCAYGVVSNIDYDDPNWKKAMRSEIQKFVEMEVFDVIKPPKGVRLIPAVWVHTYKEDDPKQEYHKSRCVVQGFRQVAGIEFDPERVLSPVTDLTSIRILTVIAVELQMEIHHIDVKSAYLNAVLPKNTPIFVRPPKGFRKDDRGREVCWKLNKAVYGLKQAGFEWYVHITKTFKDLGLEQCGEHEGLYVLKQNSDKVYVALYVDDLFVVASNNEIFNDFMNKLSSRFKLNYIGPILEYLGIEFRRTSEGYVLTQEKFINRLLKAVESQVKTSSGIPRSPDDKTKEKRVIVAGNKDESFYITKDEELLDVEEHNLYRRLVGLLQWITQNTCPQISYAVNALGRKTANPNKADLKHLIQCLKYLRGNRDLKLEYSRSRTKLIDDNFVLHVFVDASFAPDGDRHSISGFVVYLNGNLIYWGTKKQKSITQSSMAAELIALGEGVDRASSVRSIVHAVGFKAPHITVFEDNQPVVKITHNKKISASRRLVDICLKFIRQMILEDKKLSVVWVDTKNNVADLFTKALSYPTFRLLTPMLVDGNLSVVRSVIKKCLEADGSSFDNLNSESSNHSSELNFILSSIDLEEFFIDETIN